MHSCFRQGNVQECRTRGEVTSGGEAEDRDMISIVPVFRRETAHHLYSTQRIPLRHWRPVRCDTVIQYRREDAFPVQPLGNRSAFVRSLMLIAASGQYQYSAAGIVSRVQGDARRFLAGLMDKARRGVRPE